MAQLRMRYNCIYCGVEYFLLDGVRGGFCSKECQRLHSQRDGAPSFEASELNDTDVLDDLEELDDDGEAWKKAGQKFEALTRQALLREQMDFEQRSIIISGNGANLSVKNDALQIKYGVSYSPQEMVKEELYRATHGVYRIVWCAATGSMSYAALKWCYEQSIDVVMLDKDGDIISETRPNKSAGIQIKMAQFNIAASREVEIAKWLILGKVLGQYDTYRNAPEFRRARIDPAFSKGLQILSGSRPDWIRNVNDIRLIEANVAGAYFDAWKDIPLVWKLSDRSRVPQHWLFVGTRTSPLTTKNIRFRAICPAQAILNYAYGILEHVTHMALVAVGLDVSVGILHADKPGRDSLVYDLMELGRGTVDTMVLAFLRKTEFQKGDFIQTTEGEVRLHPELARAVVATCSISPDSLLEKAQALRNMIVADVSIETV